MLGFYFCLPQGHHNKGHKTKGYKKTFHKSEFSKKTKFFDSYSNGGEGWRFIIAIFFL